MRHKVLVVDDEWTIARVLSARLKAHGFELLTAPDGHAAIAAAREWRPDCVLLDVRMPDVDGLEVFRRIRTDPSLAATPVFLLTGDANQRVRNEAASLGAAGVFSKPYDHQQVISAMLSALNDASRQGVHA